MWEWVKIHKLSVVLILVVAFLLGRSVWGTSSLRLMSVPSGVADVGMTTGQRGNWGSVSGSIGMAPLPIPDTQVPPTTGRERLVVQESTQSLLVKEVRKTVDKVVEYAKGKGGYMVSSSLSQPEEAPYAEVVMRIPAQGLREAMDYFASLAVKVTNEHVQGYDVTDEYVDIQARVATLEKTREKFEEILSRATGVQEILEVQRELINLQDQIDNLKGREKYLEKTAELARVSVYLSTDEIALPYTPSETFRPGIIFKLAVRSLVSTMRGIASTAIWIGVYGVVWVPVVGIILMVRRWRKQNKMAEGSNPSGKN